MKEVKVNYLACLTLLACLLSAVIILFRETLLLNQSVLLISLCSVNALLFVYGIISVKVIETKRKTVSAKQLVNIYLAVKTGRILLSLIAVAVYALAFRVELKQFILFFVVIYFIYLLFDTWYLTRQERKLKNEL